MFKKIKNIYYNIIYGIHNLIKWMPVIWKDRDWDYHYLYEILYTKLKYMEQFHRSNNAWAANAPRTAKKIMIAKNLVKRLSLDAYLFNAMTLHDKKFEEIDVLDLFTPLNDGSGLSIIIDDTNTDRAKSFRKCGKHSDYMQKQDRDFLFKYLSKHINGWWD